MTLIAAGSYDGMRNCKIIVHLRLVLIQERYVMVCACVCVLVHLYLPLRFVHSCNTAKRVLCAISQFRSPEEYRYLPETIQIDVYSLGNIIYGLLDRQELFNDVRSSKVRKLVKKGQRSEFLPQTLSSTDPAIMALVEAVKKCWIDEPTERATSQHIKALLRNTLMLFMLIVWKKEANR